MAKKKPAAKPKAKPALTVPTAAELLADVRMPERSPDDPFPASLFPSVEAMSQSLGVPPGMASGQNRFLGHPKDSEEQTEPTTGQDSGKNTLETAAAPPSGPQDGQTETWKISKEEQTKESKQSIDQRSNAPLAAENKGQDETGKIVDSAESAALPGPELLPEASRAKKPGEKKHEYWERMRKAARLAGLARGQGPGTAYVWATEQTDREFPPPEPVIVEELPVEDPPEVLPTIGTSSVAVVPAPPADDQGVSGLSSLPPSWPELPANAQLQVEIAWVTANRLRVRSGTGVDLSKALSPAPSYSALSWLETSILFPAKFADISVKATADNDNEKEFIRREKLAIEEIRSILAEMLEAGDV